LSSKFSPPKNIVVGGRSIRIKVVEDLHVEGVGKANGAYCHDARLIQLDKDDGVNNAFLLHEATHAVLTTSGLSEVLGLQLEEAICTAMEMLASSIYFRAKK
jgi:hypothetical protein